MRANGIEKRQMSTLNLDLLPGTNIFLKEFQEHAHVPEIAQRGGAATMYPEFQAVLKQQSGAVTQK